MKFSENAVVLLALLLGELLSAAKLRGLVRRRLPSMPAPGIFRNAELHAVSSELTDMPMALPLGELSPQVTERARLATTERKALRYDVSDKKGSYRCACGSPAAG